MIKYFEFSTDLESNRQILAQEVVGIECTAVRTPTRTDNDYVSYIPYDHWFSSVEVYANGAKNLFVRSNLSPYQAIGVLIMRPNKRKDNHE